MFRNKEIRQAVILFLIITFLFTTVGFMVCPITGILELALAVVLGTVFYIFTKIRYKKIAQLSEQIDMVLHNAEHLYISEADEGELSILQSEIVKMTLRIREHNDALRKEKSISQIPLPIFPTNSVPHLHQ